MKQEGDGGVVYGRRLTPSIDGVRYFQCLPKHAIFVRGDRVTVGDFPEEDLMADDDEI